MFVSDFSSKKERKKKVGESEKERWKPFKALKGTDGLKARGRN